MPKIEEIPVYQLKVTLLYIRPPIWRRLLVRGDSTLADLHDTLQLAMDWNDYHLHEFTIGRRRFGPSSLEEDDGPEIEDEAGIVLVEVLPGEGHSLRYTYDFGDDWQHEIVVEKVLPVDPDLVYPVCTGGQRAAPPEDVGGPPGFERFVEAITNPADPEHDEYLEWLGYMYDPDELDLDEINEMLQEEEMDDELVSVMSTELVDFVVYARTPPYAKFYLFRPQEKDLATRMEGFGSNGHQKDEDMLGSGRIGILMLSATADGFDADLYLDSEQVEETEVEAMVAASAELLAEVDSAGIGGVLAVNWMEEIGVWEFPPE